MILVRGLSTTMNGVWALYITLFSLFEMVKQGLIRNATIRFLGLKEYAYRKNEVQSSALFINSIFSLIVICIIFGFSDWIALWLKAPGLAGLLLVSSANMLFLIPYNHCEILLQAQMRFESLFRGAFIRQAVFFAGLAIIYFFFPRSFTLVNVILVQVAGITLSTVYLLRKCSGAILKKFIYSAPLTYQFFHFGKYTFGTNLFSGLSRSFDHFITAVALGPLQGKDYVAYYNTVARINNMVDVPALAAADVLYPKNIEAQENEGIQKVKFYFEEVTGTVIAFVVPLSLVILLLPKLIINIIAGPEYYPAVVLLQLTIMFSMVRPVSYQFGSTLDAIGKPQINFIANSALMLVNLVLTYFFLVQFGGIGAAYATIIYNVLALTVMIFLLKKYIDLDAANIAKVAWRRYAQGWQWLKAAAGRA